MTIQQAVICMRSGDAIARRSWAGRENLVCNDAGTIRLRQNRVVSGNLVEQLEEAKRILTDLVDCDFNRPDTYNPEIVQGEAVVFLKENDTPFLFGVDDLLATDWFVWK